MCVLQVNEIFLNSNLIENVIVVLKKMKVWKNSILPWTITNTFGSGELKIWHGSKQDICMLQKHSF